MSAAATTFTIHFDEPVTNVDLSDMGLTATGIVGAAITNVSGSGDAYAVTVNTGDGDGTLRLDVIDEDSILGHDWESLGGPGQQDFLGPTITVEKPPIPATRLAFAESSPFGGKTVTPTWHPSISGDVVSETVQLFDQWDSDLPMTVAHLIPAFGRHSRGTTGRWRRRHRQEQSWLSTPGHADAKHRGACVGSHRAW